MSSLLVEIATPILQLGCALLIGFLAFRHCLSCWKTHFYGLCRSKAFLLVQMFEAHDRIAA